METAESRILARFGTFEEVENAVEEEDGLEREDAMKLACGHTKDDDEKAFMSQRCISCTWEAAVEHHQLHLDLLKMKRGGDKWVNLDLLLERFKNRPIPKIP